MGRAQKEHSQRDRKATRQYDAAKKRFVEPDEAGAARDELERTEAEGRRRAQPRAPERRRSADTTAAPQGRRVIDRPADETTTPAPRDDDV